MHAQALFLALTLLATASICISQDKATADLKSRFNELATRYKTLEKEYFASEPQDGEDNRQRLIKKHPMNTMVDEFLKLERQSRGAKIGFSCLYHLVLRASSVGVAEYPVTQGKAKALKILGEHYQDYPDIDTTFRYLFSGARIPETTEFLRKLISSSTRKYVRANAMYELANNLAAEANYPATLRTYLSVIDRESPGKQIALKHMEKNLSDLKDVNIETNRSESRLLVKKIEAEYGNELMPPRANTVTPAIINVERKAFDEILKEPRARIVDQLPSIQFELNHSIGQRPPEIDSQDVKGTRMKLSDFQGKVIVLMFSFKGCGPCEAMYPDNRRLVKDLSDEPFVFLGVQGDKAIDITRKTVESGAITWRVWWDGDKDRISTRWNVSGWPAIYVIDKQGIIRFRELRGKELETAVRLLLKENY